MDDPAALTKLIAVLKDHVIEQVGLFLERSAISEFGCDEEGDETARSSSVADRLAAASADFPFLAEVSWEAEREWRAARRRLRPDGVKKVRKRAPPDGIERKCRTEGCSKQRQHRCEGYCIKCFRDLNSICEEENDDDGDIASSSPRREGGDGQKKDDDDDDGTGGGSRCMKEGCTKYRQHGCGLYCRKCFKLLTGQATPEPAPKPTPKPKRGRPPRREKGEAAVTASGKKRKRQTWDENLAEFIAWKEEHGHPRVPCTAAGGSLGHWVSDQRISYNAFLAGTKNKHRGVMTEERARKLIEAGFSFEGGKKGGRRNRKSWEENFADFVRWKEEHGHPHVPSTAEGGSLGQWVVSQRMSYKAFKAGRKNSHRGVMNEERAAMLENAGFAFEGRRGRTRGAEGVDDAPPPPPPAEGEILEVDASVDPRVVDDLVADASSEIAPPADILEEANPDIDV